MNIRKSSALLIAALLLAALFPANAAAYTTEFNPRKTSRVHNIALAASSINGVIIYPGETFSYNEAVGPTSKSRGYRKARIVIYGEDHYNYGGGVCQVSSTLYNAAADMGLEITERHSHTKAVTYVPKGCDAATSYGGIDLKFINSLDTALQIVAEVGEGTITVELIPLD